MDAVDAPPAAASDVPAVEARTRASLLRQMEYYFSDVSFPFDEFLLSKRDETGAVPTSVLAGSPRIVSMTPELTAEQREAVLLDVVRESDSVRATEGGKLQRIWPMPDADPAATRSVYMSGVQKEADEATLRTKLGASSAAAEFLPILSIRRLRDVQRDRAFSGQVYIECEDEAKAQALLAAASKGSAGVYCNKAKLLKDFLDKQHQTTLEQREKRAAKAAAGSTASSAASGQKRSHEVVAVEDEETRRQRAEADLAMLLRVEGIGPEASRESLSALCAPHGKVAYIDFERGQAEAMLRFESSEATTATLEAMGAAGADVGGAVAVWRRPTAQESEAYWQAYRDRKAAQHANKKHRGKGGGSRGYGRGRGRGK